MTNAEQSSGEVERKLPPEIHVDIPPVITFNPYEALPVEDGFRKVTSKIHRLEHGEEINLGRRIEVGVLAGEKYDRLLADGCKDIPLLGDLRALKRDGRLARDYFAYCNLRLVRYFAERSGYTSVPLADRIQMGTLGLMRALNAYDYRKGYKFSTFGVQYIRQAISREYDTTQAMIRKPVHIFGKANKVRTVRESLEKSLGRRATVKELAKEMDIAPENIRYLSRIIREPFRLEAPFGDDGAPLHEFIFDEEFDMDEAVYVQELKGAIQRQLISLPDREAAAVSYRYGLSGPPMKYSEIAKIYGLSDSRVKQLAKLALVKLGHPSRCLLDFLAPPI